MTALKHQKPESTELINIKKIELLKKAHVYIVFEKNYMHDSMNILSAEKSHKKTNFQCYLRPVCQPFSSMGHKS